MDIHNKNIIKKTILLISSIGLTIGVIVILMDCGFSITTVSTAVMAAATVVLAVITGYYAQQTAAYVKLIEKERKSRLIEETINKVLKPLDIILLNTVTNYYYYGYKYYKFEKWQSLKLEYPVLICMLPSDLRKRLDKFSESYNKYLKQHWRLISIVKNICKEVIQKYKEDSNYNDIEIHFPKLVGQLDVKHTINYLQFIFGEINTEIFFRKYIEEYGINIAEVRFSEIYHDSRKNILSENWEINKVVRLIEDIKKEFKRNKECQKIFEFQKKIRNEASKLRDDIHTLIVHWSENLVKL